MGQYWGCAKTATGLPDLAWQEAHFATFPTKLIEPCVLAGSKEGDSVIDPFFGSGTTGLVAALNGRRFIGIELKQEYIDIAERRLGEYGFSFRTVDFDLKESLTYEARNTIAFKSTWCQSWASEKTA